jgi:hypothetical protein
MIVCYPPQPHIACYILSVYKAMHLGDANVAFALQQKENVLRSSAECRCEDVRGLDVSFFHFMGERESVCVCVYVKPLYTSLGSGNIDAECPNICFPIAG